MIDVQLLKHRTDSARHYLQLAEAQDNDVLDLAELQYTAYRIEALSGKLPEKRPTIYTAISTSRTPSPAPPCRYPPV